MGLVTAAVTESVWFVPRSSLPVETIGSVQVIPFTPESTILVCRYPEAHVEPVDCLFRISKRLEHQVITSGSVD